MFGNLVEAIMNSTHSIGGQLSVGANLATSLAQSQTMITGGNGKDSFGWTGDPNTVVKKDKDHEDWINWDTTGRMPMPKANVMYATFQLLAVINYIANLEQGQDNKEKLQWAEAARSTWSNLLNASSNSKDLQAQPFQTMSSGESSEISNAQSALQGQGTYTSLISGLSGLTAQLLPTV
jgi:hypothetical protein